MRRKQQDFTKTNGFWIAVALIVIAFLYYDPILAFLASLGGAPSFSITSPGTIPTYVGQCTDYDLNLEFTRVFGITNMMAVRDACERGGGVWTSGSNQVSCHWPSTISINCDQPALSYIEDLCLSLHANYVCSNVSKFAGCLCNVGHPNLPLDGVPPASDDGGEQNGYTCGWTEVSWGMQCGGTCPPDSYCTMQGQDWCGCVPYEPAYTYGQIGTVFVSDLEWSGAMGGLSGADNKCQVSAQNAGLPGTWKAIMSDATISAHTRLPDVSYYNLDGSMIASSKADLFDGSINNAINMNEHGSKISSGYAWTGSDAFGNSLNDLKLSCHNWGWVSDGYYGKLGDTQSTGSTWISVGTDECKFYNRIYCARVA